MTRLVVIGIVLAGLLSAPATGARATGSGPAANLALTGVTSAPAAADGNAATSWCPSGRSGTVTVDLRRARSLRGLGVTLLGDVPATVTFAAATPPGRYRVVRRSHVTPGGPAWFPGSVTARWIRLTVTGDAGGNPCVGEVRALGRGPATIIGHDLSFAVQEAAAGATYTDHGRAAPPEKILAAHGANYVRLRLWVNPPAGYSDLPSVLAMARRAKAAGMRLLLDPHYSDFWADPQKQPTPQAWADQDLPTLARTVRTYTRDVLDKLRAQGTPADMLQLGNEIRNGMLWPTGRVDWDTGTGWDALGTLLRAAAGPTPRFVVHFDQGGDNAWSRSFYDHILAQRVPVDVIGLSYYPFWHGTLSDLRANLNDLARRYHRDVAVVETQYGWTLDNGDGLGNFLWQESQLVPGYPATPNGQLGFLSDLLSIVAAVPGHRGAGVFYWAPEWIPGVGWAPGEGTPNDNLTLFDFQGRALPAVGFADPARGG